MKVTGVRARVVALIAVSALLAGVAASAFGSYDSGITWLAENGRLVVNEVEHGSQAERDGIVPGMIATAYNNTQVLNLPTYQYADPNPDKPEDPPVVTGIAPAAPTPAIGDDHALLALVRQPIESIDLISPDGLATGGPDRWNTIGFYYSGSRTFFWAPFVYVGD